MRRLLLLAFVLGLLWLTQIAAVGSASATAANSIAVVVMVLAPFALKYVKLDGPTMAVVSYAVALAVSIAAALVSGELKSADFSSAGTLLAASGGLWAVSQGIYQLLKDHQTFGPYVTGTPAALPPAPAKPSS